MKGKMTIEKLALMMHREFLEMRDEMRRGFAKSDEKFNVFDQRYVSLEQKVTNLEKRIERLDEDVQILHRDMEDGFRNVIAQIKQLREDIAAVDFTPEVHNLKMRVGRVEKKLGMV